MDTAQVTQVGPLTRSAGGRRGKVAFCFPGQGSLEAGMGKEIAAAVPEAMAVYRLGSETSGLDLVRLCFEAPLEEIAEAQAAARRHLGATQGGVALASGA